MKELRSYKEAFEPGRVAQISDLIEKFEQVSHFRGGYRVYISEIQGCLSGGLLLGAASVSYSLLELFIRDLMVMHAIFMRHGGDVQLKARVERELETDRKVGFSEMLKDLQLTVIEPEDAKRLRDFYEHTRIPLAHALVRRLTANLPEEMDDLFADASRHGRFEERIEDEVISDLEFTISIMKKYLPWLLRRYGRADTETM